MLRGSISSSNDGAMTVNLVPTGNYNDVAVKEIFLHQIELHMAKLVSKLIIHV